ncbi:MAG: hypothetical protein OXB92_17350 [Acidimicrobiaceae bacterium]|nr:hypothetical protein [Acidimicrobiaceae bacterium]
MSKKIKSISSEVKTILITDLKIGDTIIVWGRKVKVLDVITDDPNINQYKIQYLDTGFNTTLNFWSDIEVEIISRAD